MSDTFSMTANRTGYWSVDFTWEEIQTLRLRQRWPTARVRSYDGLFDVPSLDDILHMLHVWNTVDSISTLNLPNATMEPANVTDASMDRPLPLQQYQSGLYVEFKLITWLTTEGGHDIVDFLHAHIVSAFDILTDQSQSAFDTLTDHTQSRAAWKHLLPCFSCTTLRFDEYIVPGLVLQSFDAIDLQRFHELWHSHSDLAPEMIHLAAEPPLVLLVDHPTCWHDSFWLDVCEKWRSFLFGIGCDKNWFLPSWHASTPAEVEEDKRRATVFPERRPSWVSCCIPGPNNLLRQPHSLPSFPWNPAWMKCTTCSTTCPRHLFRIGGSCRSSGLSSA